DLHGGILQRGTAGAVDISGADCVDEVLGAGGVAGVADQDLSGLQADIRDGVIFEVDEARTEEQEQKDQRDHHVVVEAATLVGPEEIVAEETGWITHAMPRTLWRVMTVSPFM